MKHMLRMAVLAFAASAMPIAAAGSAQADPAACVQNVLDHDYEATAAVVRGCHIAGTGDAEDVQKCMLILSDEGLPGEVVVQSCRIASA